MTEREMTARERVKELMREFWVVYPSIPTLNLEEKIGQAITAAVAEQRKKDAEIARSHFDNESETCQLQSCLKNNNPCAVNIAAAIEGINESPR